MYAFHVSSTWYASAAISRFAVTRKARRKNMGHKIRSNWISPVGFAGKLMTLPGFRIKSPVAYFGDSGPMICNPEERLAIGRRLPSDSQTRSDLRATKSVAGMIWVQDALHTVMVLGSIPFNFDVYQLPVKN